MLQRSSIRQLKLNQDDDVSQAEMVTQLGNASKKKMWKIPHLEGGSGPGHFPHFKKNK